MEDAEINLGGDAELIKRTADDLLCDDGVNYLEERRISPVIVVLMCLAEPMDNFSRVRSECAAMTRQTLS